MKGKLNNNNDNDWFSRMLERKERLTTLIIKSKTSASRTQFGYKKKLVCPLLKNVGLPFLVLTLVRKGFIVFLGNEVGLSLLILLNVFF